MRNECLLNIDLEELNIIRRLPKDSKIIPSWLYLKYIRENKYNKLKQFKLRDNSFIIPDKLN